MHFELTLILGEENDLTIYTPDGQGTTLAKLEHGSAKTTIFPFHKALRDYFMNNARDIAGSCLGEAITDENREILDRYLTDLVVERASAFVDDNPEMARQNIVIKYKLETWKYGKKPYYERWIDSEYDTPRVSSGYAYGRSLESSIEKEIPVTI